MTCTFVFKFIFLESEYFLCLVKIKEEESSYNAGSKMYFHDDPDSFVGSEESNNLTFEAMRSWYIEQDKDSDLKEQKPEEDDINEFDHDMSKNIILNIANSKNQA